MKNPGDMLESAAVDMLESIAVAKACTAFNKEYQERTDSDLLKEESLGIALSCWSEWSGDKILRVCISALEDSNFHDEADKVQEILDEL